MDEVAARCTIFGLNCLEFSRLSRFTKGPWLVESLRETGHRDGDNQDQGRYESKQPCPTRAGSP